MATGQESQVTCFLGSSTRMQGRLSCLRASGTYQDDIAIIHQALKPDGGHIFEDLEFGLQSGVWLLQRSRRARKTPRTAWIESSPGVGTCG